MSGKPGSQKDSAADGPRAPARAKRAPAKKAAAAPAKPSSTKQAGAGRRRFTAAYKKRILKEAGAAPSPDAKKRLLKRENLTSSQLASWRKQLEPEPPETTEAPASTPAREEKEPGGAPIEADYTVAKDDPQPLDVEWLPATSRHYESRILILCIAFLTMIGLAVTLYLLRAVLIPFTLAAFLSLVLIPIIDFQVKTLRIGRAVALVLTLSMGFGAVLATGLLVSITVRQFANNAAEYEAQLSRLIIQAERSKPLQKVVDLIAEENSSRRPAAKSNPSNTDADLNFPPNEPSPLDLSLLMPTGAIKGVARTLSSGVFSVLSNGMLVMLFTAFLLTGREKSMTLRTGVLLEIETRVQKYIIIKIIMSFLTGMLVFAVLKTLDVRYSMSFGAFAFILNFIPTLGSIIATLLPVPFVMLRPDTSSTTIALAILLPTIIQIMIGSVLEPKIMGNTLGLHPVVILMALIFWGVLWGFSGMLLAVPMTAVAKIILERIEVTRPFAKLMEGRLDALNEL
ncbi:MAG: AI-2E family transporter [Candidatus Hydrogenedentes bacterium]|nr:AI-2E family transporter [Candidatus Hydrogenedentota bacterium]